MGASESSYEFNIVSEFKFKENLKIQYAYYAVVHHKKLKRYRVEAGYLKSLFSIDGFVET